MLVDANILLYAADGRSPYHDRARAWIEDALNGDRKVGLPWQSLHTFVRIATNPRAVPVPLSASTAWAQVEEWLDAPVAWIPQPGVGHRRLLGRLLADHHAGGNLVPDAALVAICLEHGLTMVSADSDFARFGEITWINPLTG